MCVDLPNKFLVFLCLLPWCFIFSLIIVVGEWRIERAKIHFLPSNRGNPFSTIFCHCLPLYAWLSRCSWCLMCGKWKNDFCVNSFMTLIFRPFFCHSFAALLQFIFRSFIGHLNLSSFFITFLFWVISLKCLDGVRSCYPK